MHPVTKLTASKTYIKTQKANITVYTTPESSFKQLNIRCRARQSYMAHNKDDNKAYRYLVGNLCISVNTAVTHCPPPVIHRNDRHRLQEGGDEADFHVK